VPPARRWLWFGLLVELSKVPVGVAYAASVVAETAHSVMSELHKDIVHHYNWLREQEAFAEAVAYDIETIPEA
jgi:hypothetical protein